MSAPSKPSLSASMPPIVYGTARGKERTAASVEQALGLGFRGVDTACHAKHHDEPGVGDGIARVMAPVAAH